MNVSAFSVEFKVGTPIGDYRLPVVTGEAEPEEGGGIARAWIEDPKVYPGTRYTSTAHSTDGRMPNLFEVKRVKSPKI